MPEQLKVIDVSDVKAGMTLLTKAAIGIILSLTALMQVPAFKDFVTPILAGNPRISAAVMAIVAIGLLLQNPVVQKILHLNITSDSVKVNDGKGNEIMSIPVPPAPTPEAPLQKTTAVKLGVS